MAEADDKPRKAQVDSIFLKQTLFKLMIKKPIVLFICFRLFCGKIVCKISNLWLPIKGSFKKLFCYFIINLREEKFCGSSSSMVTFYFNSKLLNSIRNNKKHIFLSHLIDQKFYLVKYWHSDGDSLAMKGVWNNLTNFLWLSRCHNFPKVGPRS